MARAGGLGAPAASLFPLLGGPSADVIQLPDMKFSSCTMGKRNPLTLLAVERGGSQKEFLIFHHFFQFLQDAALAVTDGLLGYVKFLSHLCLCQAFPIAQYDKTTLIFC